MEKSQWFTAVLEHMSSIQTLVSAIATYAMPITIVIVMYVCQAIGLSTIARRRGLAAPVLAWLPLGNLWILGSISDQYQQLTVETLRNRKRTLLWLGLSCLLVVAVFAAALWAAGSGILESEYPDLSPVAAGMGFTALFLLAGALWVLLRVFSYIAMFDLLRSCDPQRAVLYLLLCVIVYAAQPFIVFALRNKDTGVVLRRDPRMYHRDNPCEF